MKLTLKPSPVRSDEQPTRAALSGTVLTVNHRGYDLSELPDGAAAEHPELGIVKRNGDEYECSIPLGHGPNAPHETLFPTPIVLENHNGPIELPLYDVVPEAEEDIAP